MALSDCPKCWDTPCTCGHEYLGWTDSQILSQIKMLQGVLESRVKTPRKRSTEMMTAPEGKIFRWRWKSVKGMEWAYTKILVPATNNPDWEMEIVDDRS